jgi:CRISPR-associated protein Cse2 (CRISPR_cse2)
MQLIDVEDQAPPAPRSQPSLIGSIGAVLGTEWFPNAERAQLKRYRADGVGQAELVALRVLAVSGCSVEAMRPPELRNWIWLVHAMALLSGPGRDPHRISGEARPGKVLQKAGYSEFRLCRLLEARNDRFQALLESALRRIARLGLPLNWSKLAPLILTGDPDSGEAEFARIEIARDFSVAAARSDFRNASLAAKDAGGLSNGQDAND